MKVNILVPMAGGSRFSVQPEPLIDVAGMITFVLDNVDSPLIEATFIVIILREHESVYGISAHLIAMKPRVKVVFVDEVMNGSACTALLARNLINNDDPLLIVNSDQFVEWNADAFWRRMGYEADAAKDGNVLCFRVPMALNDMKWSYALVNKAGHITDILQGNSLQDKGVIPEYATVAYYWRRGYTFVTSADEMLAAGTKVNGEYYIASVYNVGVSKGHNYSVSFCDKIWDLAVPEGLTRFLKDYLPAVHLRTGARVQELACSGTHS